MATRTVLPRSTLPRSVDDVFDRPGSLRAMAILRIVVGITVVGHLSPFLSRIVQGQTYDESFFVAWWSFVPVIPGWVQAVAVIAGTTGGVALSLGWRTRVVGPITWLGVAVNFFLSQHHFRHNRAFLLYVLAAVVLSDSGRVLSLDARRTRRTTASVADDAGTLWPMWTLRVLASAIYFSSGFSKLIDADWVGGLVLWDRSVRYAHLVRGSAILGPLADPLADLVTQRWVHALTSPGAVAIEVFVAIGLWFPATRLAAVATAIFFHLAIEVSASVEIFSLLAIAALVIWVTPSTRDRHVVVSDATWIRRLDWLARFTVTERPGAALTVVDRDGLRRTGGDARWLVVSRLPLVFFPAATLRALSMVLRLGRGRQRAVVAR